MAQKVEYKDLLNAGVHFGHLTRKWDPRMAPYIFMERNGIHIIDLNKTLTSLEQATASIKSIVKSGRKIMFVATKKQAKELVAAEASRLKMPFVCERWLGGMLTNFVTVRKSLKKLTMIEKLLKDETTSANLNKKEKLMLSREREKLIRVLGGINDMQRLPAALFIVDIKKEHIAIAEAKKLGIPVFAMVDTNSDPTSVEFPIPANDDAYKSIAVITYAVGQAIEEGLMERRRDKEDDRSDDEIMIAAEVVAPAAAVATAEVVADVVAEVAAPAVEEIADVPSTPEASAE
jgi:small subunit ribosomal protein S2